MDNRDYGVAHNGALGDTSPVVVRNERDQLRTLQGLWATDLARGA